MRGCLVALAATALTATTAGVVPATAAPAGDMSTLASSSTFPLADRDTLRAMDGSYGT